MNRKKLCLFFLLAIAFRQTMAQKPFFPIQKDSTWQYVDKTGNTVLTMHLAADSYELFADGLAVARDTKTGKLGYINENGSWAIPPKYEAAHSFDNGMAVVMLPCDANCLRDGGGLLLLGYTEVIDKKGKTLLKDNSQDPEPAARWWFDDYNTQGMLRAIHGLSVGDIKTMMNRNGEMVGSRSGMCCLWVADDWVAYNTYHGYYYTDKKGKETLRVPNVSSINPFSEGYAWCNDTLDAQILIDKKGKNILNFAPGKYQSVSRVSDGLFLAYTGEKYVYLNLKGEVVLDQNFTAADDFSNGLAHVVIAAKEEAYIDKKGNIAFKIDTTNEDCSYGGFTKDGYALIYSQNLEESGDYPLKGLLLRNGRIVWAK